MNDPILLQNYVQYGSLSPIKEEEPEYGICETICTWLCCCCFLKYVYNNDPK